MKWSSTTNGKSRGKMSKLVSRVLTVVADIPMYCRGYKKQKVSASKRISRRELELAYRPDLMISRMRMDLATMISSDKRIKRIISSEFVMDTIVNERCERITLNVLAWVK